MSNETWLEKRGNALIATDDDSSKVIAEMEDGECRCFEPVGVRDPVSFRLYWGALMTPTAKYVRQIEIDRINRQPVYMRIFSKEDASDAMKFCVGHYDVMPVASTEYAIRKPRSIGFAKMKPEAWVEYLTKVTVVLLEKVAPFIEVPEARDDMLIAIERWHRGQEARERAA